MSISAFFEENITACDKEIRSLRSRLNGMALLRLLLFVGFAWTIYGLIRQFSILLVASAIFFAAVYIICLNIYFRWRERRDLLQNLRFVNENELGLLAGKVNQWPDGVAWLDSDNYLDDLDVFGPRSLFHLLNRTTTGRGAAALAEKLRQPLLRVEAIREQQAAVRVLSGQPKLCQLLIAAGLVADTARGRLTGKAAAATEDELDLPGIKSWIGTPPRLLNKAWLRVLLILLSLFNVYGLYRLFDDGNYTFLIAAVIVSRWIVAAFAGYIGKQHRLISHKHALLEQYAGELKVFNSIDTGDSSVLVELQRRTSMAHASFRRLSRLSSLFDQRLNRLVNLVLNTLFFYDLQCMVALERWKKANQSGFPVWIEAVGEVEALGSLATFAFNNPEYVYPHTSASGGPHTSAAGGADAIYDAPTLFIETARLAHPLIPASQRIANDLTIGRDERMILITGSNMSGKTTFLRTLGVNLLLAQCGMPVCAASFTFVPMQLLTSLRINDSLQEQTSYFMAELKKLQSIVQHLQTGVPALVLIDEILRGTNSEDKTYGSAQFIQKLLDLRCISLFATHDLTLGRLEQEMPGRISNYCFESVIKDGELYFDYRLQRGVARNRNASFLMEKMGII
jgi:MutS domain V